MDNILWHEQDYDFYKTLSDKDKLVYITDMYSGFFQKLGDDEDDVVDESEFIDNDEMDGDDEITPGNNIVFELNMNNLKRDKLSVNMFITRLSMNGLILSKNHETVSTTPIKTSLLVTYDIIGKIPPLSYN
jgi:hypothetical protein